MIGIDGFFNGHDVTGDYDQTDYGPSFSYGYDPLFYHKLLEDVTLINTSEKSYFIRKDDKEVWVAKKLCKEVRWDENNKGSLYVHRKTFNEIVDKKYGDKKT